jgi:predicted nucleic acid-binding protein
MQAILDANIAVALLAELPYSQQAEHAVMRAKTVHAPDLIFAEVANAFWKISMANTDNMFHGKQALAKLSNLFDSLIPAAGAIEEAYMMALEHGHPVYDCIYAMTAHHMKATLITADRRLHDLAGKVKIESIIITD